MPTPHKSHLEVVHPPLLSAIDEPWHRADQLQPRPEQLVEIALLNAASHRLVGCWDVADGWQVWPPGDPAAVAQSIGPSELLWRTLRN